MCFFGGIFPATIAAAEAWNLCGGPEADGSQLATNAKGLGAEQDSHARVHEGGGEGA